MKAMIFAAGLGTRLRPLTDNMPKALVPVAGKPMLERVIMQLKHYGFTHLVVNIHHFGGMVADFLRQNDNFGLDIAISDERDALLDTGGGILKARHLLDDGEPFLVHNADILTTLNLAQFYEAHLSSRSDVSLLAKQRQTQRYLVFDRDNRMQGWTNIATGEKRPGTLQIDADHQLLAFGGVHVISPTIFPLLERYSNEPKFSITNFYIDSCNLLDITSYQRDDYQWYDIGKPQTLALAEQSLFGQGK